MQDDQLYALFKTALNLIKIEALYLAGLSDITKNNIHFVLVRSEKLGIEMKGITDNLLLHTRWSKAAITDLTTLNMMAAEFMRPGSYALQQALLASDDKTLANFVDAYKKFGDIMCGAVDLILEELEVRRPTTHPFVSVAVH